MSTALDWKDWDEFFRDVFGEPYMVWHDGLDTSRLESFTGETRANAIRMLRAGLAVGHPIAAQAIRALGAPELVPELEAQLARAYGSNRVQLALTLHEMTRDPKYATPIIQVLTPDVDWSTGIEAARALGSFRGPEVDAALLRALEHDDYLVRNHACETLFRIHGVEPAALEQHPELFRKVCGSDAKPPTEAERQGFREVVARVKAMIGAL